VLFNKTPAVDRIGKEVVIFPPLSAIKTRSDPKAELTTVVPFDATYMGKAREQSKREDMMQTVQKNTAITDLVRRLAGILKFCKLQAETL
jgi:hypothetical protein